jgi:hypothetical protein
LKDGGKLILRKNPPRVSSREALRHPPQPVNDKRVAQADAEAARSAIKAPLAGVLGREWDKSLPPPHRHAHHYYLPNWKHLKEELNRMPVSHAEWGY